MTRGVRSTWVILNIVVATLIMGLGAILAALFDRRKRWIGLWSHVWARWILWCTGLSVTVEGRGHLQPGRQYIYMGNHTSALDIILVYAHLPGNIAFLAKKELFRIPFFGWAMRAMGCIPVDRANSQRARRSVDRAVQALQDLALSFIIYPEGTRTRDGRLQPFKKGAFILAIRSGLPIVPVAVSGAFAAYPKGARSLTRAPIKVIIDQPVETDRFTEEDRDILLHQIRERIQILLPAAI